MVVEFPVMVQQVTLLVSRGYHFYSVWQVKKNLETTDDRIFKLYPEVKLSKWQKSRRKKESHQAKIAYYRDKDLCILLATEGASDFFKREKWQDVRKISIKLREVISIFKSAKKVTVRMQRALYEAVEGEVLEHAIHQSADNFSAYLYDRFDGLREYLYGGFRKQLFTILKRANDARNQRGFSRVQVRIPNRKPVKLMEYSGGEPAGGDSSTEPKTAGADGERVIIQINKAGEMFITCWNCGQNYIIDDFYESHESGSYAVPCGECNKTNIIELNKD